MILWRLIRAVDGWLQLGAPEGAWDELAGLPMELHEDPTVMSLRIQTCLGLNIRGGSDGTGKKRWESALETDPDRAELFARLISPRLADFLSKHGADSVNLFAESISDREWIQIYEIAGGRFGDSSQRVAFYNGELYWESRDILHFSRALEQSTGCPPSLCATSFPALPRTPWVLPLSLDELWALSAGLYETGRQSFLIMPSGEKIPGERLPEWEEFRSTWRAKALVEAVDALFA